MQQSSRTLGLAGRSCSWYFVDFRGCFSSPSKDFKQPVGNIDGRADTIPIRELVDYLKDVSVWQNTAGQSGSAVLIFGKYVLKQVKPEEMDTFAVVTHHGAAHWGLGADIDTCGTNSLLTPFFFAMRRPKDVHWWVMMEKIGIEGKKENFWYDIKGPMWAGYRDGKSWVNSFGKGDKSSHKDIGFSTTVQKSKASFELRECDCKRLSDLVRNDVQLLRHAGITDYSIFFKMYKNSDTARYQNLSTCDPNYLHENAIPKSGGDCWRQFPAVVETHDYTLAVGIVDFGETWTSYRGPMSTMTEPDSYAETFQQSLPDYFGCARRDKAVRKREWQEAFKDVKPDDVKVICDCPVLIKVGGSAGDMEDANMKSMLVRVTSPDSEDFDCENLYEPAEIQPQCFNKDGQYIGTPHKFLNHDSATILDSHILCQFHGSRYDKKFRLSFSKPWPRDESMSWKPTGRAYWQIGNSAQGRTCKVRKIPDAGKVDVSAILQQTRKLLVDGTHQKYVVRHGRLSKQTHGAFGSWGERDFNLTVFYTENRDGVKPSIVLEYSQVTFSLDDKTRKQNAFDVCNEILRVETVSENAFSMALNNKHHKGYTVFNFRGANAADWVHDILRAQASCDFPCLGTAEQLQKLDHCQQLDSIMNVEVLDEGNTPPPKPPPENINEEWEQTGEDSESVASH
eukprot:gnl/MRDRNA2_/MRDRNA2_72900_c0_seq2.p1 gnl/MRDRNA2_/MRDRNA2_72900_c0~~gnl/MRDRNA2_/MRDRNA2_72900_c0_seq2.p1  ORF type:complete len:679 (+),score=122.54 gnl/MRDRNA2_/MRDRNA2_72900_c0_seq2:23-2059(+)